MSTETVPVSDEVIDVPFESIPQGEEIQEVAEERVPLSALQKERRKRQEIEQELRWHKEQQMHRAPVEQEPDDSLLEAATKQDLNKIKSQAIREVEERSWIKQNPERAEEVNERLAEFLKQRPNLASAIEAATNRYEEAWELMDKLTPKQKAALKAPPVKKDAPGSPNAVPKAAALNEALNLSDMSDSEFNAWRKSKRKAR